MSEPLYVCWTIDCESTHPAVSDVALGRAATAGFGNLIENEGWRATLFATPEEAAGLSDLLGTLADAGHEIGLHPHPLASGFTSDYLGEYSCSAQSEIVTRGCEALLRATGRRPTSCRPGYGSANDSTFRVLAQAGFRQTSASFPGRKVAKLASIWAGAPLFAHYAHPYNRCLEGGLDLVEIPVSVDWESMIWGGIHPQDLRVELTDAKNHSFLIEKIVRRQCDEQIPMKAIVILTHNIFRFDVAHDFRCQTVQEMAIALRTIAARFGLEIQGLTVAAAAEAFRQKVPFSSPL